MKSHGKNIELQNKLANLIDTSNLEEQIEVETMIMNSIIMEQIDFYLKENNMNRNDLAEKLGVSKSYISQLFSCNKIINLETLATLKKKLNLNVFIKINPPLYSTFCDMKPVNDNLWKQMDKVAEVVEPSDQYKFKKLSKRTVIFNGQG